MALSRFVGLGVILLTALALAACSSNSPTSPGSDNSVAINLNEFPDSGDPVPDGTVLTDQWAPFGILFDAEPAGVNLIKMGYGSETGCIFFSPDVQHAIAVFRFVEPGTMDPVDITAFELNPWFNTGESAELVGLDESGAEVAIDTVVPADIGSGGVSIKMSIQGNFRVVEWRTHGDPGIAAGDLAFEF
jgi:hypothetical protein